VRGKDMDERGHRMKRGRCSFWQPKREDLFLKTWDKILISEEGGRGGFHLASCLTTKSSLYHSLSNEFCAGNLLHPWMYGLRTSVCLDLQHKRR
jgi:hypothetical protein